MALAVGCGRLAAVVVIAALGGSGCGKRATADASAPPQGSAAPGAAEPRANEAPPPARPEAQGTESEPSRAATSMTEGELAAIQVDENCVIGDVLEISVDELAARAGGPPVSLSSMDVATAGAFLRDQGYAITELSRCCITGEHFKQLMGDSALGGLAKLFGGGEEGTAVITTISGANDGGTVQLHFAESSKRCWPKQPRVQSDRYTGTALWQHDKREVGLWCFSYETVDIDPECGTTLLDALMEVVPAATPAPPDPAAAP